MMYCDECGWIQGKDIVTDDNGHDFCARCGSPVWAFVVVPLGVLLYDN